MSNNNETEKLNFIIKKRKPNEMLNKKMYNKIYKFGTRSFTIENEEKNKNKSQKGNNRKINFSQSYKNFNECKNDFETQPKNDISTYNLKLQKINFVPKINRHKRNLKKFINIIKDDDNKTKNEKHKTINSSYGNFNSFYKRKKRYSSSEANIPKKNYIENNLNEPDIIINRIRQNSTNVNSGRKNKITNLTYNKSLPNFVCDVCFDKKMLEEKIPRSNVNRKELLAEKFINENPFYFIDKMNDIEKKRIQTKLDNQTNKQRLVLSIYEEEVNNPRNLEKEKLQLINEYSINPLAIEHRKDPKFLKLKVFFDEKEKLIQNNPDIYPGLAPRKALQDYYEKCMYQLPTSEEVYKINPVFKAKHAEILKKQIDDKKKRENDYIIKTKTAEYIANKQFNEYKKNEKLNDLKKNKYEIQTLIRDNQKLDNYKKNQKEIKQKEEEKFIYKLDLLKDKDNKDYKLRYLKEKYMDCELYQKMFEDMNKKHEMNIYNKKEENRKWNNYLNKYNMRYGYANRYNNCDLCNKPIPKNQKLKKYPPSESNVININY